VKRRSREGKGEIEPDTFRLRLKREIRQDPSSRIGRRKRKRGRGLAVLDEFGEKACVRSA